MTKNLTLQAGVMTDLRAGFALEDGSIYTAQVQGYGEIEVFEGVNVGALPPRGRRFRGFEQDPSNCVVTLEPVTGLTIYAICRDGDTELVLDPAIGSS